MSVGAEEREGRRGGRHEAMNLTNIALLTQLALRDRQARLNESVGGSSAPPPNLHPIVDVRKLARDIQDHGLLLRSPTLQQLLCTPADSLPSPSFFIALEEQAEQQARDMLEAIRNGVPEALPQPLNVAPNHHQPAPAEWASNANACPPDLEKIWGSLRQHIIESCEPRSPQEEPPTIDALPAPFADDPSAGSWGPQEGGDLFDDLQPLEATGGTQDGWRFGGGDLFAEAGMPSLPSFPQSFDDPPNDDATLSASPTFGDLLYSDYERGVAYMDSQKVWGEDDIYI